MLTEEVVKSIDESVLCWLATVNKDGVPNVSPKEMFVPYGEKHLLIANIASPASIGNIKDNPNVCVSLIEIFKQKGHKLKGLAKVLDEKNNDYSEKVDLLKHLGGEGFPIKGIIEIEVTSVAEIIAPSYWLYPDVTTEESQINQSLKTYGVKR